MTNVALKPGTLAGQKKISLFQNLTDKKPVHELSIDEFIENVENGAYRAQVGPVRSAKNSDDKKEAKRKMPAVSISGTFSLRKDDNLDKHSGFICMDIDDLMDPDEVKIEIKNDPYIYAAFISCSGKGLAILFRIDGTKHRQSFDAISQYLYEKYSLSVDPCAKNESRLRFVTHDPNLHRNDGAKMWTKLPKKQKEKAIEQDYVHVRDDFERIIQEIDDRKLDIAGSYENWIKIGFALVSKFNSYGEKYFLVISQHRNGDQAKTDDQIKKKYASLLKGYADTKGVTMATFYHFAKEAGVNIQSEQTEQIIQATILQQQAGIFDFQQIIDALKEETEFDHKAIEEIVPQVSDKVAADKMTQIDLYATEIQKISPLRRNLVTMRIEALKSGKWLSLDDTGINSLFLNLKKKYPKLQKPLFTDIVFSNFTRDFNPLTDFIDRRKDVKPVGLIKALAETIESTIGLQAEDKEYFIRKWILGLISSIYGQHSPLMLILAGEKQNTGKTEWFRRLLPPELSDFFGEINLANGKDDLILMTQKLILLDDEMEGKNKDSRAFKALLSKQFFYLRAPYGKSNIDMRRLAVLGGTSNEMDILTDPTGNRRFIPIHVDKIDHKAYNAIDKTGLLLEAYHAYIGGESHNLTRENIEKLNSNTNEEFTGICTEEELFFRWFREPQNVFEGELFTNSDIVSFISDMTRSRIDQRKLGMLLKKKGIAQIKDRRGGPSPLRCYKLVKIFQASQESKFHT